MRVKTILVFLGALALTLSASAQTKMSGTATCKADPVTPVSVGDMPGHLFVVSRSQCTWTGAEIAGLQSKEGVSASMDEINGDTASSTGDHTATMSNGDKTVARFHGSSTSKDGKFVSGGGTWMYTNGTGKLKGIKGKGTYKGTPNADGTVSFKVEGEYWLPKS